MNHSRESTIACTNHRPLLRTEMQRYISVLTGDSERSQKFSALIFCRSNHELNLFHTQWVASVANFIHIRTRLFRRQYIHGIVNWPVDARGICPLWFIPLHKSFSCTELLQGRLASPPVDFCVELCLQTILISRVIGNVCEIVDPNTSKHFNPMEYNKGCNL